MEINEKINRVLNIHRVMEVEDKKISKREFDIVQNLCWIKWEYNSYKRLKSTPKREYIIEKLEYSVNYLYDKYMGIQCLK